LPQSLIGGSEELMNEVRINRFDQEMLFQGHAVSVAEFEWWRPSLPFAMQTAVESSCLSAFTNIAVALCIRRGSPTEQRIAKGVWYTAAISSDLILRYRSSGHGRWSTTIYGRTF
jgi:hypothetical protein